MAQLEFAIWDGFYERHMATAPTADLLEQHLREAALADELGYHSYFVIEHQNSYISHITSPSVYLAAVAQRTERLRVGAMLYVLPFHNPIRLAQEVALLDQLSRGRVEFGTGIGVHEHEFIRWNLPFYERQAMASEALEIILKAWTEELVTYEGKYWRFNEAVPIPRPYQQPYPPVWVGAHSPASLEYAAKHNFHVAQNIDVDSVVAEKFQLYRQVWQQCDHPGPMPRLFLMRFVHVAPTDAQAEAEAKDHLVRGGIAGGGEWLKQTRVGFKGVQETSTNREIQRVFQGMSHSYEFWIDNGLALVGSPDTVIQKIQAQQQYVGYDLLCTNHRFGELPTEQVVSSLTLFGREVIPAFRARP